MAVLLPLPIPSPINGMVNPIQQRADEIDTEVFCIARPSILKDILVTLDHCDKIPFVAASVALHKRLIYEDKENEEFILNYLIQRGFSCMRENKNIVDIDYITHPRKKDDYNIFNTIIQKYKVFLYIVRLLNASTLPHMVCKMILDKVYEE